VIRNGKFGKPEGKKTFDALSVDGKKIVKLIPKK
jgi:hypothetical protein